MLQMKGCDILLTRVCGNQVFLVFQKVHVSGSLVLSGDREFTSVYKTEVWTTHFQFEE